MIISSSRPNTLPANLQGVWNTFNAAPWAGNYQSNINLQEIYWSCGPTDLAECQQAYIDWIDNLSISGRKLQSVYMALMAGSVIQPVISGDMLHRLVVIHGVCIRWEQPGIASTYGISLRLPRIHNICKQQAYPLLKDASVFWLENLDQI